jgi:Ser/Thr protein kinase RdoA (MazF antagonist)
LLALTEEQPGASYGALQAAVAVGRAQGLTVTDPQVVRDVSNVLVHLRPAPIVARVATATALARPDGAFAWLAREVELARYLDVAGAPVVAPVQDVDPGPHRRDGFAVTLWPRVEHDPTAVLGGEALGASLRELHEALAGFDGQLPALDAVLDEVVAILDRLAHDDVATLRAALARLRPAVTDPALPVQPLHGDAHAGNLLLTQTGPRWTDFEDTCSGPLLWDLACLVASARTLGPPSARDELALRSYGEVEEQVLAPFVEARALQVTAWTLLMAEHQPRLRERAEARMRHWRA